MYAVARRTRRKRREHLEGVPVLGCRVHLVREAEISWAGSTVTGPQDVIAHNHPSGDPTPSPDDIRCARSLRQAGELLGVTVLDVVVGRGSFRSLKQRGDI
jgi:DNA repair protein RadC